MKTIFIVIFFAFVFSGCTYTCSCQRPLDIKWMNENAAVVFVGKASSKEGADSFTENKYKFKMIRIINGKEPGELNVWSYKSGSCGADFKKEGVYIVFAYKSKEEELRASGCSSWEIDQSNAYYLDKINGFYAQHKVDWTPILY